MMEMVVNGVSTRKIERITEELCGKSFSKSSVLVLCKQLNPLVETFRNRPLSDDYLFVMVDAIYVKVRINHHVSSVALLVCYGINQEGYREIIGFELAKSESENSWGEFFERIKHRGLGIPRLIVSDNHTGLVHAVRRHFCGTTWQRCQAHFSRNVLDATPKALQGELKDDGIDFIIVTHEMGFARHTCDKLAFVYEGKLLEYGTSEQLFSEQQNVLFKQFLGKLLEWKV